MNQKEWTVFSIGSGIILTIIFVQWLIRYRQTTTYQSKQDVIHQFLRFEEKLVGKLHQWFGKEKKIEWNQNIEGNHLLEIFLIGMWSFWFGRKFLNFNTHLWPTGREFGSQMYSHNFWITFRQCGLCALWNGNINGGTPALANVYGATLHPLVLSSTLLFGVVNGAKVITMISLWIAGFSQWWISLTLNTRRIVRLWSGGMAVVGGHLIGKIQGGSPGLVLSIATASLFFASTLHLNTKQNRKAMVLMGIIGGLLLLSGHGYMQLGTIAILPAFLLFFPTVNPNQKSPIKYYLGATVLSLLLAGVVLIPYLHFSPNFEKWTNTSFNFSQPLQYIPLNLVISDWDYYISESLGKLPYPYLINIYVGWIPVLMAISSIIFLESKEKPLLLSLYGTTILSLFFASGIPFRWFGNVIPYLTNFRHTQLISSLMVPGLLGISAFSLENLYQLSWPKITIDRSPDHVIFKRSIHWLLIIPMILSIHSGYQFNKRFFELKEVKDIYQLVEEIQMPNMQWIGFPGEHFWIQPAIESGLKITNFVSPYWWKDREVPKPHTLLSRQSPPNGYQQTGSVGSIPIYVNDANTYAKIVTEKKAIPCIAQGNGGHINIDCPNITHPGQLIIKENLWSGWKAWRDGGRIRLHGEQWLEVDAPPGEHHYTFRYLPWDVPLGMSLTAAGLILSVIIWRTSPPRGQPENKGKKSQ